MNPNDAVSFWKGSELYIEINKRNEKITICIKSDRMWVYMNPNSNLYGD